MENRNLASAAKIKFPTRFTNLLPIERKKFGRLPSRAAFIPQFLTIQNCMIRIAAMSSELDSALVMNCGRKRGVLNYLSFFKREHTKNGQQVEKDCAGSPNDGQATVIPKVVGGEVASAICLEHHCPRYSTPTELVED